MIILNEKDADKWIAKVLQIYQVGKKLKEKKHIFWLIYVTPFHSAALIGHLWLWQRLLEGLFCNYKWIKFALYGSPNLVLHF